MPASLDSTSWNLPRPKLVLGDHCLDLRVGARAWLDAVNLAAQLFFKLGDVGEGLQALVSQISRHGEGRTGVFQAWCFEHLDLIGVDERRDGLGHQRVPVTEEHVQTLIADPGEDNLLGRAGLFGVVAEAVEQDLGHGTGGDHVGPVDHAHAYVLARCRVGRHDAGAQESGTAECKNTAADQSFHVGFLGRSFIVSSGICRAGDAKLRSCAPMKAHCGDWHLHCSDLRA
jgi:hypothetical protein